MSLKNKIFANLSILLVFISFLVLSLSFVYAKDFIIQNATTGNYLFVVNGTTGYVGIGLVNPSYSLQIAGDVYWSGTLQGGNVPWARLTSFPSSCSCQSGYAVQTIGGACTCIQINATQGVINGSGSVGQVAFFTGSNTISGNDNLYWDNTNARLGIGTKFPQQKLDVAGNVNVTNNLYISGNVGIGTTTPVSALTIRGFSGGTGGDPLAGYTRNLVIGGLYNQPYNSGNATLLEIRDYSNDAGDNVYPIFVADENSNIDFFLKAGTTNSNSNAIAYFGGNVGIGIMSPSEKLEVSGNIKLSGYINVAGSYIRKAGSSIVISDV